jgi:hypothetical protein
MEIYTPDYTAAAERFTAITEEICRVLGKHGRTRFVGEAMLLLIWNRLMGLSRRFARLAERLRTGTPFEAAPARKRDAVPPPPDDAAEQPYVEPPEALRRHFRWLVNMIPETEQFAVDLCRLLHRLEMEELIFAAPRQAGRILRPMCKMLGVEPTAALRLPVRVPVPSAAVASEPEEAGEPEVAGESEVASKPEVDDGIWPQSGGPSLVADTEAEVLEGDSQKRA